MRFLYYYFKNYNITSWTGCFCWRYVLNLSRDLVHLARLLPHQFYIVQHAPSVLQTARFVTSSTPSIFSEISTSTLQFIRCSNIFKICAIDCLIKLFIFYWKLTIFHRSRWLNRHLHVLRNSPFNIIIIKVVFHTLIEIS
jgi:hypothetical protein